MKKILLLIIISFTLISCGVKEDESINDKKENEEFKLEKVDNTRDFVYSLNYKKFLVDGKEYNLEYYVINIKGENIDNVNLELKSFVNKSYQNMLFDDNELKQGNVINYNYYKSSNYLSVIQKYYPYMNGEYGEEGINVYVISLNNGKVLSNEDILEIYDLTEEDLYKKMEDKIESEDVLYSIMNIKKDGYDLFINNDGKLVASYYEVDDVNSIRKEIVL